MSTGPTLDPPEPGALPPGQELRDQLLVKHYGPIPRADDPDSWAMTFGGRIESGEVHRYRWGPSLSSTPAGPHLERCRRALGIHLCHPV